MTTSLTTTPPPHHPPRTLQIMDYLFNLFTNRNGILLFIRL